MEEKKYNDLEVLGEMARQNKDIRMSLDPLGSQLKVRKKYAELKMAIDEDSHHKLTKTWVGLNDEPYQAMVIVINRKEFDEMHEKLNKK